jgi:hypothetical protein
MCLLCHPPTHDFNCCLQANNSGEVASLASLLLAVGRYSSLEAAYIASRLPLITAMWDEAAAMLAAGSSAAAAGSAAAAAVGGASAGGLAGGWLLLLFNNLMGLFEGDAVWLGGCLQQQRQQLLVSLMGAAFDKVGRRKPAWVDAHMCGWMQACAGDTDMCWEPANSVHLQL